MKETVVKVSGEAIEVDISEGACGEFGVKHNDRILYRGTRRAIAKGVAPAATGSGADGKPAPNALWIALSGQEGATYVTDRQDISLEPEA